MICSSCNTAYSPAAEQLGQVEPLAGYCDTCGTEPRLKRFAIAFIEGAISGVFSLGVLFFFFVMGGAYEFLIPPLVVALICAAVYLFAIRSDPVRYKDEAHRKDQTLSDRIGGWVIGFIVGLVALFAFFELF